VLVIGPENCVKVARHYGFHKVIGSEELQRQHPELVPLRTWPPGTILAERNAIPYPEEIGAVFLFTDPLHAFHDIQITVDVLTSPNGRIGSFVSGAQTVPFFSSADDLLWATDAPLPRLGQGAFREMLASVYESVTGNALQVQQLGKPRAVAFAYAEMRLAAVAQRLGWDPAHMQNIFMVGDNLETDIVGANARGGRWVSVHVLSGVGRAPSARRTLAANDLETEWMENNISKTPHYVAPTLDHFVRELLAFKRDHVLANKEPYFGPPCPVDLEEVYGLKRFP
jgi:HAD superfamily hydrolase (TIGR01456 family)